MKSRIKKILQPPTTGKLESLFNTVIEDLKRLGPMKVKLFAKYYSDELLDHLLKSRDIKMRESHIGRVVVLNQYKYRNCHEDAHSANTLTSSLILRAGLYQLCDLGPYVLVSRSSTSAWISKDETKMLMLARQTQPSVILMRLLLNRLKTKPARIFVVVPKKRKNFYSKIKGYEFSILELGSLFTPVHNN